VYSRNKDMAQNVFVKPENWDSLVHTANTLEAYKEIVKSMFSDGRINQGRIHVLAAYTKDVCLSFPEIQNGVVSLYLIFMAILRSRTF